MVSKQTLHEIVDNLPDDALAESGRLLNALAPCPLPRAFLEAADDDEPVTPEDDRALTEARKEQARGELIPLDEVEAEFTRDAD